MIRQLHEKPEQLNPLLRPTPEMLERRRQLLDEMFGMWDNAEGERIAKWIEEAFRRPEPNSPYDRP